MKQILQNIANGNTEVANVPRPDVVAGHVLIGTRRSLISAGTERMLVDFGNASWLDKARQQPDKVKQVLQKIRTDGLGPTMEAVRAKLDTPLPMGYCNAGVVLAVGAGVTAFKVGQRVASNGKHAEVVAIPQTLCVGVPDEVGDDEANQAQAGNHHAFAQTRRQQANTLQSDSPEHREGGLIVTHAIRNSDTKSLWNRHHFGVLAV